jgi:hypothetical protein
MALNTGRGVLKEEPKIFACRERPTGMIEIDVMKQSQMGP